MSNFRIEHDSMGKVKVPKDAYYQAQTHRALENFQFSDRMFPHAIIITLIDIKSCAAQVNCSLGLIDTRLADSIQAAASQAKKLDFSKHFPLDVFQTGSGTSSNMNVNEVLAKLAADTINQEVHPNDHVNLGQSSNDVIPSAIQISAVRLLQHLYAAITPLNQRLILLADEHSDTVKTGRTHLMDAMPITLGQELSCWRIQLDSAKERIKLAEQSLLQLPIGGTAVGTGVNTHKDFAALCCKKLKLLDHHDWQPAATPAVLMSSQDHHLALMAALKNLATCLLKIANDLRWMNSGPQAGLQEIQLQPLQPGSSIMPGKVNPVIPEAVAMIAAEIMGNEQTVSVAAQSSNFQLNVMLPIIGEKINSSIKLLTNACNALTKLVFSDLHINKQSLAQKVGKNPMLATALNSKVGYDMAAKIAKMAIDEHKTVLDVAIRETSLSETELRAILDPIGLTNTILDK
ncbi:lyase family protein [uncultured Paraglaciecola sp.]|uniref:class II fumarate hydratase n=1 Tax=uncultured Paraglaciecola sp. TaxID=1765024 RepID=UPI002619A8B0|nr:lyase family protein [uncultured Paraglaciecola sp.]